MYEHPDFILHNHLITLPWIWMIHSYQILLYVRIFTLNDCNLCTHVVASKSSPYLLELLPWRNKYTLTSFSALWMQSEENALKNGEPRVGTSFTKVLQHTGQFWSRISQQGTLWQHCSIPNTLLTWLQLIFTCSLDWNQNWRDSTFVMLLTLLRMWWKNWKYCHQMASRNVSSASTVAVGSVQLRKGILLKDRAYTIALFCISNK